MTGEDREADGRPSGGGSDGSAPEGDDRTPANGSDVVRRDRFSGGPAREFLSSLDADRRIFEADLAVDRAHVVMLAEQGIVDEANAGAILAALDEIETAGYDALPDGEDVHAAIETAVIQRIGEEGGRMHTARSRNDEVATCIRYRLRADLLDAIEVVNDVREALLAEAKAHTETLMPGYTHLQPAQPITVGFWLASYESALARDAERLLDAYERVNRSPLGAAAFAGTTFDVDRERTAELLGFDGGSDRPGSAGIVENAMDAAASRDVLLEAVGALATLAVTCSGLAEDVIVFANRGFVELDDDYASTSSIMPQKKNPDTLELVRAATGDAVGAFSGLATTLKGLPRAYNRDLQGATPHAWEAVDATIDAVEVAGGAVATATWNEEALASAAAEGFSTATGVADLLAREGIPFRTAHEIVALTAEAVEDATDHDEALSALEGASRDVLGEPVTDQIDREAIEAALDPAASVAARDSLGGPASDQVRASVDRARDALQADRDAVAARRDALASAAGKLDEEVERYR